MIKRLEWLLSVPEAMNAAQVEVNIMRLKYNLVTMSRSHVERRVKTVKDWLRWYHATDFPGRFPTNQKSFAVRALPLLESRLLEWGVRRHYIKTNKYDNRKSKREEGQDRDILR